MTAPKAPKMGDRNVERVLLAMPPISTHVSIRSTIVLVHMAKLAHDSTGLYFGGIEWLEQRVYGDTGTHHRRAIMRNLAELEKQGYVSRTAERRGRKAVYQLHLPDLLPSGKRGRRRNPNPG